MFVTWFAEICKDNRRSLHRHILPPQRPQHRHPLRHYTLDAPRRSSIYVHCLRIHEPWYCTVDSAYGILGQGVTAQIGGAVLSYATAATEPAGTGTSGEVLMLVHLRPPY